jgi:hypothetical protein
MFRNFALATVLVIAQQTSLHSGTLLPIRVNQAVSGETIQVGSEVSASLSVDLVQNSRAILPGRDAGCTPGLTSLPTR